ncbi:MAG: phosphoadenylyl-sulfate reductase [Spirochaetia bacterium]|nr:phosphoadenylyl-sulfate reductase [Spirochaetia bacterium]
MSAEDIIQKAFVDFKENEIALLSGFAAEEQVVLDMLIGLKKNIRVITLDTGRLFQETHNTMQASADKYGVKIEVFAPESLDIKKLIEEKGPNSFYESVENRKQCCHIRKVLPLQKAFQGIRAVFTGLRKEQSPERENISAEEFDENRNVHKINPLYDWKTNMIWHYIKDNKVPYNKLHDKNFLSIGCMPCTRPVLEGENIRSGRWWWEDETHKECGIHR